MPELTPANECFFCDDPLEDNQQKLFYMRKAGTVEAAKLLAISDGVATFEPDPDGSPVDDYAVESCHEQCLPKDEYQPSDDNSLLWVPK